MKNTIRSFSILFILFSLSILFVSCSQESGITSPNESQATTMSKTTIVATTSINHSTDTVITLPQCGKTLVLSKSYTAKQISQIDNYLATHTLTTKTSILTPNALQCNTHNTYNTVLENEYKSGYQKNIGIWCDYFTYYQCHNYGFNQYFVTNLSNIQTAIDSGFTSNNIMASLSGNYTNDSIYINGTPKNIGYYFLDEPLERNTYTTAQIYNLYTFLASKLPSSQLCMASYDQLAFGYVPIHLNEPNAQIMCDEYHGNILGDATDYWDWFRSTYTYNSNINWMHVVINNGTGGGHNVWTGNNSSSWSQLFTKANSLNQNHVWLFASGTGNEAAVQNFCLAAWQAQWMYRYQLTLETEWQCTGTCTTCSWPIGDWQIVQANIVSNGQWVNY